MKKAIRVGLPVVALAMLVSGAYFGLVWSPPEREMGDVYRIIYMHVPLMWMTLLACCINFIACVAYLVKADVRFDALAETTAEVGLVLGTTGLVLGSIWGRPTWGVWWTWDPRLTSMAIFLVAYAGYLALRKFVEDPERRAVWSAVSGIIIAVDYPVIYFSVRWWRSLHQTQSTPKTLDWPMVFSLRWNAFALLFVFLFFLVERYRIAVTARRRELVLPDALPSAASPRAG